MEAVQEPEVDQTAAAIAYAEESGPAPAEDGDRSVPVWRYRLVAVQHHRSVYRFACSLLKDDAEAEDMTQEAFLRFWQFGRDVRRPREWLLKVVYNACLDRLRKAGRFVDVDPELVDEHRDDHDPAWHYGQSQLARELERLVATLPEPQRSLIVLFDVQGFSGDECARVLGINRNQVKVYLHRARRRLRSKLEQTR
jgi:RNA polymerase sigma-70 factor, ECF subfamily